MLNKIISSLLFVFLVMLLASCGGAGSSPTYTSAASTGYAVISWNPVTTYTNGDSLSPTGYKIRYGTAPGTYTTMISVPLALLSNPNAPRYTLLGLTRGTRYYFVVSAYDSSNVESALSSSASKTIP